MQVRLIGIIGEGQYGRVFLGERSTGCSSTHQSEIAIKFDEDVSVDLSDEDCSLIAVKQMNKFLLLALKSQKRAIEELMGLQVCLRSQNPWIVQLAFAFQDSNNVYIATEYLCGGNLRSYIQSGLSKEEIRFIFTELVLAIHSLHSLGFMHRDLKPENIVFDSDGHLKLIDLGFCKSRDTEITPSSPVRKRFRSCSKVGSVDYMAPEIITEVEYDQLCDYWSCGVILYEMAFVKCPFYADTPSDTLIRVIEWERYLEFPPSEEPDPEHGFMIDLKELVNGLLCPAKCRFDFEKIIQHRLLNGIVNIQDIRCSESPLKAKILSHSEKPKPLTEFSEHSSFSQIEIELEEMYSVEQINELRIQARNAENFRCFNLEI